MKTIYQLKKDSNKIDNIQKASLESDVYGLQLTHGLFGSQEWWDNIESGALPVHSITGIIDKVYMAGMRDYPEFSMKTDDGEKFSWAREVNNPLDDGYYQAGKQIEVDYVLQKFKDSSWLGPLENENIIAIRIEE